MMDSGPAGASDEPTVASVLGIKGQLRFHPHGSTQKAHVVLRQVELSEESDEEGDSSMVYFSLFAQKRIEVKPGKEILLAVATPDGKFLETPVVFAAKVSGDDELTQTASPPPPRIDTVHKARPSIIPPKLRKPWHEASISEPTTRKSHPQPSYASVAVQAVHDDANLEVNYQSVTITPIPNSPPASASQNITSQAAIASTLAETSADGQQENSDRERSLSPMELDSRSSSPAYSPPPVQQEESDRIKSTSFSPPGLSIPIPSPQQSSQPETFSSLQTVQQPKHRPLSSSPDSDDPPGLSLPPLPADFTSSSKLLRANTAEIAHMDQVKSLIPSAVRSTELKSLPTPEPAKLSVVVDASGSQAAVTPYVPKRKTVPNPFVSGGLLTDFVGNTPLGKTTPQPTVSQSAPTEMSATPVPSIPSASRSSPVPTTPTRSSPDGSSSIRSSPRSVSPGRSPARTRRIAPSPPSSPASSSKVKIEDVPPLSTTTRLPSPGRSLTEFAIRPQQPIPSRAAPTAARTSRFSHTNSNGSSGVVTTDSWRSVDNGVPIPPPDYRQLAYIAEGSYSNPLGIKPAGVNGWRSNKPLPPQISTSAPPKMNGPPKKPVAIGNGWPYNRQNNGSMPRGAPVARRSSFQNGPITPPGVSIPPADHVYPKASPTTSSFASSVESKPEPRPPATHSTTNGPATGLTQGSWNTNDSGSPPLFVKPNPSQTNVALAEVTVAPVTPISSSDPYDSPTNATHSLPPKPIAYSGPIPSWTPSRGVKRMGSPTPLSPDTRRQRTFKWPTSNGLHSVRLKGTSDSDDIGVRTIIHSSDGSLFAVTCCDKSVRIWSNKTRTEVAKLAHNMQIIDVAWMDRDAGIVTLGENGIVSTWTRSAANKWQWAKILDASGERRAEDNPCCLAFCRDRLAIAYPRSGVKIWLFVKGTWSPQRSIVRQNVTAIKFIEDGEGLVGGTTDGVLWHCQVPNGTLRAYTFMRTKISTLDIDPKGTHALAAQTAGCILVNIGGGDGKGNVEQAYTLKDPELQSAATFGFAALFATRGLSLLFGTVQGCVMVWDRASGDVVHGLYIGEEHTVQAIASFDGSQAFDGYILTGTRQGQLTWFSQPPADGSGNRKGAW